MKIETQTLEDHQVKMTVEVETATFEDAKRRAARKVAQRTKIPGFRPGKAPYQVIARQVGEAAIVEEALDILINEIYPKALDETGIKAYGPGSLQEVTQMDPLVLDFLIPLAPEITLSDYLSIRHHYELPQVSDDQVDEMVKNLRDNQAVVEPVDRPAQANDLVYLKLSARRTQPTEENPSEALIDERSLPVVVLTEVDPNEWPFQGFSQRLIGLKAGHEQTFTHTFGSESEFDALRNVEAEFNFIVEDVKSRSLPEVDDDFAKSLGPYENVAELLAAVRASLERQSKEQYNDDYEEKILDDVVSQSEIKFPPKMVEEEIDSMIHNLGHRLENQGMDLDLYMKTRSLDMQGLRDETRSNAEKRLKRSLVLMKIADQEKIEVSPQDLQQETIRTYSSLVQSLPEKEARRLNDERVFKNLTNSVLNDLLVARSRERLRKIANGEAQAEAEAGEQAATAGDEPANEDAPELQAQPEPELTLAASVETPAETEAGDESTSADQTE